MSESEMRQPLPERLAARLPAGVRDALQHPYRRQIVRALHRDVRELSPSEVAESGLVPCSIGCAAYHMDVLARAGLLRGPEAVRCSGSVTRSYSARTAGAGAVAEVLRETEQADQRFFTAGPS